MRIFGDRCGNNKTFSLGAKPQYQANSGLSKFQYQQIYSNQQLMVANSGEEEEESVSILFGLHCRSNTLNFGYNVDQVL